MALRRNFSIERARGSFLRALEPIALKGARSDRLLTSVRRQHL